MPGRYIFLKDFAFCWGGSGWKRAMLAMRWIGAALATLVSATPLLAQEDPHKSLETRPSPWRSEAEGVDLGHATVTPEPHPVRFESGLNPMFKITKGEFSNPGGPAVKIPGPHSPDKKLRRHGQYTDLADRLDAIEDHYDEMKLRPVTMDNGGGIEYRKFFGATPKK
jgi:hypothetical protein